MQQVLVFLVLAAMLALFVHDRFRFEAVALCALLVLVVGGVVPPEAAFLGFGHPAVVTVAAVLIITRGLANAGVADALGRPLDRFGKGVTVQILLLSGIVMVLSAFINNVGALALMMPVAIRQARRCGLPVSLLLMPMAFASLLGGLQTAIGTPPNLIVAEYRHTLTGTSFAMFDFTPVGLTIAAAGVLFLVLFGWRLLPRRRSGEESNLAFTLEGYMTEIRVPPDSKHAGLTISDMEKKFGEEVAILGLVRGDEPVGGRLWRAKVRGGDVLVVHGKAQDLKDVVQELGFELAGRGETTEELLKSADLALAEVVLLPDAWSRGRTARSMDLRRRFGLNLLAFARQGSPITKGLSSVRWTAGDILLLEGDRLQMPDVFAALGCLPLATRDVAIDRPRRLLLAVGMLVLTVVVAAVNWVPIHVGFVACALAMAAVGLLSPREAYRSIDWPVIILLAAIIPVGTALETTGAAAGIVEYMSMVSVGYNPVIGLAIVLITTMFLSDVVNNAAAAVLMCPIGAGVAAALGVSADPFLMAVAVGASCAFLTPVGHQSNTLVMGPGGYRFGDYWRLGLPIEFIVAVLALLLIPVIFPFQT